jgi:excisionase family DNA binding protein
MAMTQDEPILALDVEAPAIRELDSLLAHTRSPSVQLIGPDGERVRLPASVQALLASAVHELARGRAVTVVPVDRELTTQRAADVLNVSRPFLIKLLESGEIPFHCVGAHRRIRFEDLMAYRQRRTRARREVLAEMAREAQELGLYE